MWPFDQNNQQAYQQYSQAYDNGNYNNIDPNQAMGHFQQFVQNAPPDMQQQVYQQHFEQMPYDQRVQFAQQMPQQYGFNPNDPSGMAQGFQQMGQQQPNMLSQLLGQGGAFGNPMASAGLGGLVGLAAKAVMNRQGQGQGMNPMGGIFGGQQNYGMNQQYDNQQYYGNNQQGGYGEGERREEYERREGGERGEYRERREGGEYGERREGYERREGGEYGERRDRF